MVKPKCTFVRLSASGEFELPTEMKEWRRKSWPKRPPELTREDGEKLLTVAADVSHRDWLILKLIMQSGFKTGEVVGSHDKRTGSRVQGVRLRDIGEDFIWIQRLETPRDVEPEIIRELRKFAFNKQPNDFVFDLNASTVRKFTKNYAKNARIKDWPYVHPDSLRFLLAPKVSQFRRELRKLFIDDIPVAEKMSDYYIANYCLENNLRRLIRETLSEHGENWWLEKVPQEIKNYVLDRQRAERDTPMSIRSNEPLDYATFGHLKVILDANWRDFQDKIRSQKAIGEILNELNELRAVIAHSCDLNDREKTRLQLRVKDWLDQDLRKHT